jgi:hypothetical protein
MNVMTAIVFAATQDSGGSRPSGLIHPQYLPALAQSRLLQVQFAELDSDSSVRPIRSWWRKALRRPLSRP